MRGWTRATWYDETGLTWRKPSPNLLTLESLLAYVGTCLFEALNVSEGRGTDTPFEVIGAPWLDGQKLAKYLNERNLAGVRFVPVKFKPAASVFKDENLGGVNIVITERKSFKPVRTGIEIAAALRRLYPNEWQIDRYLRLLVSTETLGKLKNAEAPEEIEKSWQKSLEEFKARRAKFLLYL